jgi:uridylate kinase
MKGKTVVLSLGGSVIVPEEIDIDFLRRFKDLVLGFEIYRFIIICGGGKLCRNYQNAARKISEISKDDLDWIGIRTTRLNAEFVRSVLGQDAHKQVIHDPHERINTTKRIMVGGGFKPGSSTDLRAVQLAKRFGAKSVINMSNIDYVYTADPREDPHASKLDNISWPEFRSLVGDEWDPGLNMPFDPVASKEAQESSLEVIIIGNDVHNLERLLKGESFRGTTIS